MLVFKLVISISVPILSEPRGLDYECIAATIELLFKSVYRENNDTSLRKQRLLGGHHSDASGQLLENMRDGVSPSGVSTMVLVH